ncbi:MAG: S49 family peptidase [Acidimicrobiales bacterium]
MADEPPNQDPPSEDQPNHNPPGQQPPGGAEPPSQQPPGEDARPAPPAGASSGGTPRSLDDAPPPTGPSVPGPPPPAAGSAAASVPGRQPPPPTPADVTPGSASGPRTGEGPGSTAWYSGPLPIEGLAPRETVGSAIGRTAVKAITALVIIGGGLFAIPFLFFLTMAALIGATGVGAGDPPTATSFVAGDRNADVNLVAVPVAGLILGEDRGGGGGLFAPVDITYGYTIKEELARLAEDDSVDGVILEVNSPGGTIFGSNAIAEGVEAYRETSGKPIVAYVSGISASGGVYSMAGADKIYADYGTLVGSIGVIFGPFTTYDGVTAIDGGILGGGVTTENGIEVEFLTAGRSKDFGNPYRAMTDEERAVLQQGLDDAYADFVGHVSKGRDIPVSTIEDDLGALIFGEQQAVANGLIDGVANRDDSYRMAAEAAGLEEGQTWRVERLETGSPGLLGLLANGVSERVAGDDDAAAIRIDPLCLGTGTVLAFHGDPNLLCSLGG